MAIIALGPIGFLYILKAFKWQLDVVQPQLNTATFFRPCVKLFSENSVFSETFAIQAHHYIPSE